MESGEIKSRSPFSTETDTFYCLWPAAVGFLGLPGSKCISFCTGGTSYFITVQESDEYQMSLTSQRRVGNHISVYLYVSPERNKTNTLPLPGESLSTASEQHSQCLN